MYVCSRINIHVAVVKTGLSKDQTLLTGEESMRSSAIHEVLPLEGGGVRFGAQDGVRTRASRMNIHTNMNKMKFVRRIK